TPPHSDCRARRSAWFEPCGRWGVSRERAVSLLAAALLLFVSSRPSGASHWFAPFAPIVAWGQSVVLERFFFSGWVALWQPVAYALPLSPPAGPAHSIKAMPVGKIE
ncbi:MAG: hypothetical protein C5B58_08695, partial [Acidobacteria bacterium]